jgi:hypothetical protein
MKKLETFATKSSAKCAEWIKGSTDTAFYPRFSSWPRLVELSSCGCIEVQIYCDSPGRPGLTTGLTRAQAAGYGASAARPVRHSESLGRPWSPRATARPTVGCRSGTLANRGPPRRCRSTGSVADRVAQESSSATVPPSHRT